MTLAKKKSLSIFLLASFSLFQLFAGMLHAEKQQAKKATVKSKSADKDEKKPSPGIQLPESKPLPLVLKIDSVCISYRFSPGDTLVYRAVSEDSVNLEGQTPVIKERAEIILVVCDSVGRNGHYYLSQKLAEYAAKESSGAIRNIVRTESDWIGKKVQIEVDSLGMRHGYSISDTSIAALAPGGAFQPVWLPLIGEACKHVGTPWLAESTDALPENGFPIPVRKQNSMLRFLEPKDTLGFTCNRFQYTQTSQGSVLVMNKNQKLRVNSVIAGFGIVFVSRDHNLPVHHYVTNEIKLTIKSPGQQDIKGKHFINTYFTLVGYRPIAVR